MPSKYMFLTVMLLSLTLGPADTLQAEAVEMSVQVNQAEVDAWNLFADKLLAIHTALNTRTNTTVTRRTGSYGGVYASGYQYVEESFTDKNTNKLVSRIRWHNQKKQLVHTIEIFIYDSRGNLVREYTAAYLPNDRNAPYQTLINLHTHNDGLYAYRQFDASGERIFEKCEGRRFNGDVLLLLEDYEMPDDPLDYTGTYLACFSNLPMTAGPYLDPEIEVKTATTKPAILAHAQTGAADDHQEVITRYSRVLDQQPNNITAYTRRADAYLASHEFDKAIADYSTAIKLDPGFDEAYFGRGIAYGRNQQFERSIQDLSEYIRRHPNSSRAYTKRGVRYIWMGKLKLARIDLTRAIELDAGNAEANDDIGVLYAQEKQYATARKHFLASIKNDPTYQKAYHNLALTYYLTNKTALALEYVDKSLELNPASKNSMLLKAEILERMGRTADARKLASDAQFLNALNWSESMAPME